MLFDEKPGCQISEAPVQLIHQGVQGQWSWDNWEDCMFCFVKENEGFPFFQGNRSYCSRNNKTSMSNTNRTKTSRQQADYCAKSWPVSGCEGRCPSVIRQPCVPSLARHRWSTFFKWKVLSHLCVN